MDSLISSFKPFIWVGKFYGIFPFQFDSSNIKISKCVLIWGICVHTSFLLILIAFIVLNMLNKVEDNESPANAMGDVLSATHVYLVLTFALITYLSYLFHITRLQRLYGEIFKYSNHFDDYNFRRKAVRLVICETFFFFVLNWMNQIFIIASDDSHCGSSHNGSSDDSNAVDIILLILSRYFSILRGKKK